MNSPTAAAKHSLRALARRWLPLDTEVRSHDAVLGDLTAQACVKQDSPGVWGPSCGGFGDRHVLRMDRLILVGT